MVVCGGAIVACCLLSDVSYCYCCLLFAVCCLLIVVRRLLVDVGCLWFAVC